LTLGWALLTAVVVAAAPAPPVVSRLEMKAPAEEDVAQLERMAAIRSGEPLTRQALRRTVQVLYELGRFSNVRVRTVADGEGKVAVTVECLPKRIIRELRVVRGNQDAPLTEEKLIRLANLPKGEEFYNERVERAAETVRSAYQRMGWRSADVRTRVEGQRDVTVEIVVEEGSPTQVGSMALGGRPVLAPQEVTANLHTRPGQVLDLDRLDEDVRAIRAHYRRRGHLRAMVESPEVTIEQGRARIVIPVEAGPEIRFRFTGNGAYNAERLQQELGYDPEQPLDPAAVEAATDRLRGFYQSQGFYAVRITTREVKQPAGQRLTVAFEIHEGRRYRVTLVRFLGVTHHDEPWMRDRLREYLEDLAATNELVSAESFARVDRLAGGNRPIPELPLVDPAEVFYEPAWHRALDAVADLYRGEGFIDVSYQPPKLLIDERKGTMLVEIIWEEGPRTFVDSVAFEGNKAVSLGDLAREARFEPGEPLSFYQVEQTRVSLLNLYARRGFLYASVKDQETFTQDRKLAAVTYRIHEGPQVHIANVVLTGHKRTDDDVIRDTLTVEPGDVYDPEEVAASQTALLRLGVFRSVALRLNDPELPEASKDLYVDLAERPYQTIAPGIGFSIANGPRAFVEYSRPNLFGRALELSSRAKVNYPLTTFRPDLIRRGPNGEEEPIPAEDRVEGRADVGLHYARFPGLPLPLGGRLDLIGERLRRRAYGMTRGAGIAGLDLSITNRITVSLQYELEVDDIRRSPLLAAVTLSRADVERLRFPEGVTVLRSLRPALSFDYRDNSAHPRSGWFSGSTLDIVHSIGTRGDYQFFGLIPGSETFTDMLKLSTVLSGYLPIAGGAVLALSTRAGRVFPLSSRSVTIAPKRFYMGGSTSMRGYAEDEMLPEDRRQALLADNAVCSGVISRVGCSATAQQLASGQPLISEGGESFVLVKGELRFPIQGSLEGGLFVDAGNLWLDPLAANLADLRLNAGLGLRFVTPVGPVTLDLGFNLDPDQRLNERTLAPHFSVGVF
jgi:outer membrane protein assembly factor BamA